MGERRLQSGAARIVVIILVILLIAIASAGIIIASDTAIPGDPLYPVDTAIEDLRIVTATTSNQKTQLRVLYAKERVQEINYLLDEMGVYAPGLDIALINFLEHVKRIEEEPTPADSDYIGYWEYELLNHKREGYIDQLLSSEKYSEGGDQELLLLKLKELQNSERSSHSEIVDSLKNILLGVTD